MKLALSSMRLFSVRKVETLNEILAVKELPIVGSFNWPHENPYFVNASMSVNHLKNCLVLTLEERK